MRRLLDLGVDGLMTDRLALLRDAFADRGLALDAATAVRRSSPCARDDARVAGRGRLATVGAGLATRSHEPARVCRSASSTPR